MEFQDFVDSIAKEINYQADKWADGSWERLLDNDIANNTASDFVVYINRYASAWCQGFPVESKENLERFKECMIKVAALAYSAQAYAGAMLEMENSE